MKVSKSYDFSTTASLTNKTQSEIVKRHFAINSVNCIKFYRQCHQRGRSRCRLVLEGLAMTRRLTLGAQVNRRRQVKFGTAETVWKVYRRRPTTQITALKTSGLLIYKVALHKIATEYFLTLTLSILSSRPVESTASNGSGRPIRLNYLKGR